jgi:hypothetical protein
MAQRNYDLPPELLSVHEAGHMAALEYFNEKWYSAHINPDSMCGHVNMDPSGGPETPTGRAKSCAEAVIGRSAELKTISYRMAARMYAGIAAERLFLGLPFDPAAFIDHEDHDFRVARYLLGLTDSTDDWNYCAFLACEVVSRQRARIEYLAAQLLERKSITCDEVQP